MDYYCWHTCGLFMSSLWFILWLTPRGIILYSVWVCLIVGIGSPHPLPPQASVSPPLVQKGGGSNTLLRVRGWGDPIPTTG